MDNLLSVMVAMPELLLTIFGFIILVVGLMDRDNVTRVATGLTLLAFGLCAVTLFLPERLHFFLGGVLPVPAFGRMFVDDGLARFVKLLLLIAGGLSLLLAGGYLKLKRIEHPEYPVLVLFATLGMMLMVSAHDFLALYVGLELQSLCLYVLAAFKRTNAKSSEAGLKYFVLGSLSSGFMLYGISLIYGYTGTTDYIDVAAALRAAPAHTTSILIGMVFIFAAMAFKVSAVPFHMWAPDVYEGSPTPVTAFLSSAPKLAALVVLMRLLHMPFSSLTGEWDQVMIFIAVASMLLGSFAGLVQSSLKRLMAYSSIANIGFALIGLAVTNKSGMIAMLIYTAVYAVNVIGAFGVILCLRRHGEGIDKITDLAGLGRTKPLLALGMLIFTFSLAGVPPFAGFFAKYMIFIAAVEAHMIPIVVVGVFMSVVSAFYYLRIINLMYFEEVVGEPLDPLPDFGTRVALVAAVVFVLVFTVWPTPVIDGAIRAVNSFMPFG